MMNQGTEVPKLGKINLSKELTRIKDKKELSLLGPSDRISENSTDSSRLQDLEFMDDSKAVFVPRQMNLPTQDLKVCIFY